MSETFLTTIYEAKRKRVEEEKRRRNISELRSAALQVRSQSEDHRLRSALKHDGINIVAEIKRASPSKGVINDAIDVAETAKSFQDGGAASISVLTEADFFKGSLDDLRKVRAATSLPILRKDFVFDEFQIYEAAEAGADAILLIVAMLDDEELARLRDVAENDLGLDALIEVHNSDELGRAKAIHANLIGVNNRNLHSFDVSLDVSRKLIKYKPDDALIITESGITSRNEIDELRSLGFDGFLIGETLMRTNDASGTLKSWI
jgi:indole-3-glycerol phosphate synthase